MNKCLLCQSNISSKTKPEHVLLNALGGKFKSFNQICDNCNNNTSNIDKELAESVEILRNLGDLQTDRGGAPYVKNITATDGKDYTLRRSHKLSPNKEKLVKEIPNINGRKALNIQASSIDKFDKIIRGLIEKKNKETAIDVEALAKQARDKARIRYTPAPKLNVTLKIGGDNSGRSMAKSCLVLWAECVGNSELQKEIYSKLKNFIMGVDLETYGQQFWCCDVRIPKDIPEKYSENANFIWVGSDHKGKVLGYYRLLGIISFVFILAETGGSPNKSFGLISNPWKITTRNQGANVGELLQYDWVTSAFTESQLSGENAENRLRSFVRTAHEKARATEIARIERDTIKYVFDENTVDSVKSRTLLTDLIKIQKVFFSSQIEYQLPSKHQISTMLKDGYELGELISLMLPQYTGPDLL